MKERERWELRGDVQTCAIERILFAHRCGAQTCKAEEWIHSSIVEFRGDGALARCSHVNPDSSAWTTTTDYAAGRLTAVRNENGVASVSLSVYEYDAAGRLARIIARSADRPDHIVETYDYDLDGRKKKTLYIDLARQRPDIRYSWGVEGTDSGYSAPGAATLTTLYNEREQPTQLLFHDAAGRFLSSVDFTYDADAHIVGETQRQVPDILPSEVLSEMSSAQRETLRTMLGMTDGTSCLTHRYDGKGRRIETRLRMGLLGGNITRKTYNDHGDPITETSEHQSREYAIDGEGQSADVPKEDVSRSEARLTYEYDTRGNWVLKMVETRSGVDLAFTTSSVERRSIRYFR